MPEVLELCEGSNGGCSRYALFVYIYGTAIPEALDRYEGSNGGFSRYALFVYL